MFFGDLPDDVIQRIFYNLHGNPNDYLSLASTCKRFRNIASERVVISSQWMSDKPLAINLNLELAKYNIKLCKYHKHCREHKDTSQDSCELGRWYRKQQSQWASTAYGDHMGHNYSTSHEEKTYSDCDDSSDSDEDDDDCDYDSSDDDTTVRNSGLSKPNKKEERENCYYHRFFCLLNAKYTTFSSLKFRQVSLSDRGCIRAFQDSIDSSLKVQALVELELSGCDITLDWLNTMLNAMDNVRYLTLDCVSFKDSPFLIEPKNHASKVLKSLKITGDRNHNMNDATFMYFMDNFPAAELDLSRTKLEHHRRIIQRFYPSVNTVDFGSMNPSELIFSFPQILLYLKKYSVILRHFVASHTEITFPSLKKILQEDRLKHLKITAENCSMITQFDRWQLAKQMDKSDLERVKF